MHLLLRRSAQRYCFGSGRPCSRSCSRFSLRPSLAQQPAEARFAGLPGSWTGTGTIALSSGAKERIRCRASYRLDSGSTDLRLEMSCGERQLQVRAAKHLTTATTRSPAHGTRRRVASAVPSRATQPALRFGPGPKVKPSRRSWR